MRHGLRIFRRVLAALFAAIGVLAGFTVWLLAQGPISLDPIAPEIAAALSRGNGITATVDHTLLSLDSNRHFAVLARGVHLSRDDGNASLTLGEVYIEFSVVAALRGAIAPIRIVVTRPELRLVRERDGSFHLGIGDSDAASAEDWGAKLVGDLASSGGAGTLAELKEVSVEHAGLSVDDRLLGIAWRAADANASLLRSAEATSGKFAIVAGNSRLSGDYVYAATDNNLVVRLAFADLRPALWADASPGLAGLAALGVPFSGQIIAVIDGTQLMLRDATWDIRVGAGEIRHPMFAGGVLTLAGARMQAGYDPARQRINIGLLAADLTHGKISVSGAVDGIRIATLLSGSAPPALDIGLDIAAAGLKVDDFPTLWPEYAAIDPRDWATQHLHDGTIDRLQAHLAMRVALGTDAGPASEVTSISGTFSFSGLSVEYFRPLPPVRNVSGTAHFDRSEIEFDASAGAVGKIAASNAVARFYQLDMPNSEQAKIVVTAAGPLAEVMELLDTPPLYYARDMGIDAKQVAGGASVRLDFAFPLLRDLPLERIDYAADARLTGVGIADVLLGKPLSDGALTLNLDRLAAGATGTAKIAGIPVNLTWHQALQPKAAIRTRYDIVAQLDAAQRKALGLGLLAPYADGTMRIAASYSVGATRQAEATIDLDASHMEVPLLGWSKNAGVPASAHVVVDLAGDRITRLRDASFSGGGMDIRLGAEFAASGLERLTIGHLAVGQTDISGGLSIADDGRWTIAARGKSLDATGLLKALDERPANSAPPPLSIDADLDRLLLGPGRSADQVSLKLVSDGPHWSEAAVAMRLGDTASAQLNFGGALGARQFKLTTDDFGALLKFADVYDNVQGGSFSLTGAAEDRDGKRMLVAAADGSRYRVVGAPALARLLSLASLSGIGALLSGQGIPFSQLGGQVIIADNLISLDGMRAYGGALGINASGDIDRVTGKMNVAGTLVPAYTLNSVLGDIPLLGNLLVGGEGQGIFAANFRIYGPRDDPKVSVNPLSTLAPGILRKLFLFSPGGP